MRAVTVQMPVGIAATQALPSVLPAITARFGIGESSIRVNPARSVANWFAASGRVDSRDMNTAKEASASPLSRRIIAKLTPDGWRASAMARATNSTTGERRTDRPRGVRMARRTCACATAEVPRLTPGNRQRAPPRRTVAAGPAVEGEARSRTKRP